MTLSEISSIRLVNQRIAKTEFITPMQVVGWMGAMQAQDFSMAKWAVGIRMQDATDKEIENSFNKGEILRTHLMRPTWHFVAADDIYWMLDLTAPQIRSSMKSRHKQLELSEAAVSKSNRIIEKALSNKISITRSELAKAYENAGIRTGDNRLSHLLLCAELDGLICSGPVTGGKESFSLLQARVPDKKFLTRDESLAELAKRYFSSHGPATFRDFIWWSGLPVKDAGKALESVNSSLLSEIIDDVQYWFTDSFSPLKINTKSVHLLPAFDEFLISYRDRSASLSLKHNRKAVSDNGIFRPLIILNGQVAGTWKRTIKKDKVMIGTNPFQPFSKVTINQIKKSADRFGDFLHKNTEVKHTQ